jgi:hypothetical protein
MVTFDPGGGLGNRIFQYVVARLLAEKLGFSLNTGIDLNGVLTPTPTLPGEVYNNGRMHIVENEKTENIMTKKWGKHHIHLQGFWQNANYYLPHREKILGYFKERAVAKTDKKNIVIHVRLGDYKIFGLHGNVLDPQYYFDCFSHENFERLFVVTDEPEDSYFDDFAKYAPIFSRGSIKRDFWFLTEFDRIIMGNSTFSWWAAFLSNATKIYTPKCWIRNSPDLYHELHVIDNGKCENIQVDAGYRDFD